MKKLSFILLLLVAGTAVVKAQSNVVKINIFSPIVRTFNVSYEHVVKKDASFQLGFFYTGYSASGVSYTGLGITPEYRFYLSDTEAPAGVYVAPFLRYQNFTLKDDVNNKGTLSTFGGGVVLGKQWIFKNKFSLDGFVGPAYSSGTVKASSGSSTIPTSGGLNGFGLRLGLTFGIAF